MGVAGEDTPHTGESDSGGFESVMKSPRFLAVLALVVVAGVTVQVLWGDSTFAPDSGCSSDPDGPAAVIGVDSQTAAERWSTTIGEPVGVAGFDAAIVVGTGSTTLRSFEPRRGALLWCVDLEPAGLEGGGVVRAGEVVVAVSADELVAFDPSRGTELWRRPAPANEVRLDAGDDVLVVRSAAATGDVLAPLDPSTGDPIEGSPAVADPPPWFGLGQPQIAVDDLALTAAPGAPEPDDDGSGQLLSVAVRRGDATLWAAQVPGFVAALVPSAVGPVVMVLDQTSGSTGADTRLRAHDGETGDSLWEIPLPGSSRLIAPVSADLVVVPVGTELHGVDPATGSMRIVGDFGSPGMGGEFVEDGEYQLVRGSRTGDTFVGLIVAERSVEG